MERPRRPSGVDHNRPADTDAGLEQPLELVADYQHQYRGYWEAGGDCRISLYRGGTEPVIVCSAYEENSNRSITNMAELLAAEIADQHFRNTADQGRSFIWIEHYLRTGDGHERLNLPAYSLVRFDDYTPKYTLMNGQLRKTLGRPAWQQLTERQYEALLNGERIIEPPFPR